MEILVELVMEVLGAFWEEGVKSPRVPKAVRTVLLLLLMIPVCGLVWLITCTSFADRHIAAGIVFGVIALFLTVFAVRCVYKIWHNQVR